MVVIDVALETYMKAINDNIMKPLDRTPTNHHNDNIESEEQWALSYLHSRMGIIIEPADKGSAMVVMSKEDYLVKVMSHLQNTQF